MEKRRDNKVEDTKIEIKINEGRKGKKKKEKKERGVYRQNDRKTDE